MLYNDAARAKMTVGRPSAVGGYRGGRAPDGTEETAGNVWEWTRSLWGKYASTPTHRYPYEPDPAGLGRECVRADANAYRVARGGAFGSPGHARSAYRLRYPPAIRSIRFGFRVSVSPFVLDPLISDSSDL